MANARQETPWSELGCCICLSRGSPLDLARPSARATCRHGLVNNNKQDATGRTLTSDAGWMQITLCLTAGGTEPTWKTRRAPPQTDFHWWGALWNLLRFLFLFLWIGSFTYWDIILESVVLRIVFPAIGIILCLSQAATQWLGDGSEWDAAAIHIHFRQQHDCQE